MSVVTIFLVFIIVWWLAFFLVLPYGNRAPDTTEVPGTVASAPARPRLWLKAAIATALAAALTAVIVLLVESRFIDFLDMHNVP